MTTDIERHIVNLMTALRPEWGVPGCVAALRALPDMPIAGVAAAAIRYAADPKNLTPGMLTDLGNRAWVSDWHPTCRRHPQNRSWRIDGTCASCWADSHAVDYEPRQPVDRSADPHPLKAALARGVS